MISPAVVGVLVANRPHDGHLVRDFREVRNGFAELHARKGRGNWLQLASNFLWRVRLRIESLIMRRAAIEPDHDAVDLMRTNLSSRSGRARAQPEQIGKSQPHRGAETQLDKIPPGDSRAISF